MAATCVGDTLTVYHEIVAKRPPESRPGVGVTDEIVAENDDGEAVISSGTARDRDAAGAGAEILSRPATDGRRRR